MTNNKRWQSREPSSLLRLSLVISVMLSLPVAVMAQGPGIEDGQWTFMGGDAWHTRYSEAAEIDASNFENLDII